MNAAEEALTAKNVALMDELIDRINPSEDITVNVHQTITTMHGMESPEFIRGYLAGAMNVGCNPSRPFREFAVAAGKLIRGYDLRTGRPKKLTPDTNGAALSNSEVVDL